VDGHRVLLADLDPDLFQIPDLEQVQRGLPHAQVIRVGLVLRGSICFMLKPNVRQEPKPPAPPPSDSHPLRPTVLLELLREW
jgi:hypothetical protein